MSQDFAIFWSCFSFWNKLKKLEEIELVPYQIYRPDLAPSDYYLFQSMAHFLHSQCFNNQEEVKASLKEFFTSKGKNWYQHGIKELVKRWLQRVQHVGLYFECKATFLVT